MFKKFAITFLSVCIAVAMTVGTISGISSDSTSDTTLCIMDFDEVSC